MYCIHCGVELSDSETVCPLCGTRVFHPDLPRQQGEPPFPPEPSAHPEEVNRSGALFILTMLAVLPIVICILCDWSLNGTIVWSGFASGGVLLLYILAVLPLWFRRPNPVIFVPADFAAIGLYLLYINFATGGHWFLTFALPVTGTIGVLVTTVVTLLRYLSRVGLLRYHCHSGYLSTVVQENEMANVLTPAGGIFRRFVEPGQEVEYGQKMGVILDPFTAEVEAEITCPTSGVVFFALKKPLTTEHEVAFKVIRRLHGGCL